MTNGKDDDALPRVLAAAMEAAKTNDKDDDALPRVPATGVAIATTSRARPSTSRGCPCDTILRPFLKVVVENNDSG
jgi:hypothetical protein